jgi:hypothetical protein
LAISVQRLIVPAFLIGGLLLLMLPLRAPLNYYDEGLALFNAMRVMQGDLPFQDFWAIYPPGQSYALAAVFSLFGTDVAVARLYDTFVRFGIALAVFVIADRLISRRMALLLFSVMIIMLAAATFYGYAVFPALLFGLLSILAFTQYTRDRQRRWLFVAGLAIGVTAAYRLDVGAYTGISVALALLIFEVGRERQRWPIEVLVRGLTLVAGTALVMAPFYGYLALVASPTLLWENLIGFPTTVFPTVRRLPLPPLALDLASVNVEVLLGLRRGAPYEMWLLFYLPLLIYAITAAVVAWGVFNQLRRGGDHNLSQYAIVAALAGLGAGLFSQAMSRYDGIHVLPTSIFALTVAAWLLYRIPAWFWRRRSLSIPSLVVVVILALPYTQFPLGRLLDLSGRFSPSRCHSTVERAACVPIPGDQQEAIKFIQNATADGEAIFVGNRQHDLLFANDISFYFLANRPSATRYHELHPGLANTLPVQQEMVAELAAQEVKWLVTTEWGNPGEPNASAQSSGVHLLDEFIQANYVRTNQYGSYIIWQRSR